MTVTLPDGTALELPDGATGADAAAAIGEGLARAALGIKADGELLDLSAPLPDGAAIEIVTQTRAATTRSGWCATTPRTCSPPR